MKNLKTVKIYFLIFFFFMLSGCNKQKAEALKIAAEEFRTEAISSLNQINYLFIQNISVTTFSKEEEIENILRDLNSVNADDINATFFEIWDSVGVESVNTTNDEFEKLKAQYYQFESMFTSLDKGSYFAKDAVKKAEKHAINLTLQLINYSTILNKLPIAFANERSRILENMINAKKIENQQLQQEFLKNAAQEFIQLRNREKQLKDQAIKQCLIAAQNGKVVAELIRDYDKMNVADLINSVKNSLGYVNEISNGNKNVSELLKKFEQVETTIKEDPYWKILLNQEIITND